ncbi:tetratricopeptide repeat-containing sensor histidine kinase [Peijinzhouia sedimentorum]
MKSLFFTFSIFYIFLFGNIAAYSQNSSSKIDEILSMKDGMEKLDAYLQVIRTIHTNYPDSTLALTPDALRLAQLQKDKLKEAEVLYSESIAQSVKGLTSDAIDAARLALNAAKSTGDMLYESRIISHLGTIYGDIGNYAEAAKLFDQALKISEKQNDSLGVINGYLRLGVIQSFQNQDKEAIDYYNQSLEIARAYKRTNSIRSILNNIGISYAKQNLFEQALIYFHEAEELEREGEPNISNFTQLLGNIGQAYYHTKNYNESLKYLKEAEEITQANSSSINPTVKINNNVNFGKLYMAIGQNDQAEIYLNDALAISNDYNYLPGKQTANEQLTEFYISTGDFEKALKRAEIANDLRDSIYNAEKFEIIENLKTRYEVEKKDAELTLLADLNESRTFQRNLMGFLTIVIMILFGFMYRNYTNKIKSNKELMTKQEELEETNRMKNKLFSIIGHDLRGPFQGLLGGLLLIQDGAFSDAEKKDFIQRLIESGKATHEVLESLLIWGKAQSFESNPEKLNSKKLIEDCIKPYKEAARQKNITLVNNAEEEFNVLVDYKEFEFVLRNLINNAIKYTHPDGQVSVNTKSIGEKLKIDIIDNGVGIPSYRLPGIFELDQIQSTTGTKNEAGSGLGLVVCHDLITKNKGEIMVESEQGHGSKFSIILPLA